MGIISLNKASRLYWLGRYTERVYTGLKKAKPIYDAGVPGEGATHAWVELALPDGWHGYDPTFACEAGEEHLRFAVGRDAADCRAERGIFLGAAEQTLHTEMRLDVRKG